MKLEEKIDKYLNEQKNVKQEKKVKELESKGYRIVIREVEFVAMMDKKGSPAEVYPDGTVKYPKKRY